MAKQKIINTDSENGEILDFLTETTRRLNLGEIRKIEKIDHIFYPWRKKFLVHTPDKKFLFKFYDEGLKDYPFSFINFLNSTGFPMQELMSKEPIVGPGNIPVLVYSFLEGNTKPIMNEEDLRSISHLIAGFHSESDNFYRRPSPSKSGFVHGDLKSQNIVFKDNKPHLIDSDNMKVRAYAYDVAYFVFFNALSDLYNGYNKSDASMRSNIFIRGYMDIRKLDRTELSNLLFKRGESFRRTIEERLRVIEPLIKKELEDKKNLINLVYEVYHDSA